MPRLDKWLTEVGPRAPVPRAARKAARARLRAVGHLLRQAAQVSGHAQADAEAVHQLRIWTRRAGAVLRLFAELFPRRTARWLRRMLRKIRRTAGEARDCDVLAERLENGEVPGLEHTAVHLRVRRKAVERDLARLHRALGPSGKLARKTQRLIAKTRWRKKAGQQPPFGPWCRGQLAPLAGEFLDQAGGDLSRDAQLHALRIAGKRLRYALELAPAAMPPAVHRRLYRELTDVQDRLGEVCDGIAAAKRLRQWLHEARDPAIRRHLRSSLARQQKQLAAHKQRFLRWWSAKRRTALRRGWERALRAK